ncbi:hypothetical protein OG21DRAFT_1472941 [Imleria badia]|nr:hypothetical protein OG21DRAFT_1472941 [Imleria badia]
MFDRRVIPQSLPCDLEFREEYSATTGFIWPESWHVREDLPPVDAALEPCVQELLESVATLKMQPGAIKCIPVKEFPVDLRILEQSFSGIFQASRRSREKKEFQESMYEAAWRHDHDRLLFDFFIRLIQQRMDDTAHSLTGGKPTGHLEDPLARPTLEATLRFPMSDSLQKGIEQQSQRSMRRLINREAEDLDDWVCRRGSSPDTYIEEDENASYVNSQWLAWRRETVAETEAKMISKLGQFPSTGRCDALGRLVVELPNVSPAVLSHFPLVVRAATNNDAEVRKENKAPRSGSRAQAKHVHKSQSEDLAKVAGSSLTIPDDSDAPGRKTTGTRYTMLSSSIPSSMQWSNAEKMTSMESMDILTRKTQRLQIEPDATRLELPILTVEYKKASNSMMKGTNQVRMYLTASVKFLQAVGITNIPVYGVQTDGPVVVLPAAVLQDDNFVYLFERLVERLDISTPLGAWHYATILCRLAQNHAEVLEKRFEEVGEKLVASLLGEGNREGWTIDHQIAMLKAEKRGKSPPREKLRKQKSEAN